MKKRMKTIGTLLMTLSVIVCAMACDKENTPDPPGGGNGGTTGVTGITLNKTSIELEVNGRETITATIAPANATFKTVAWNSSNEAVAKVTNSGEVTGVAAGTATVTAKAGNKTATCAVTVKASTKPLEAFSVKITGAIDHNTHTPNQSGTVEFSRFPATVDEFKQARDVIGSEPHGAVALQIMAFEMYRRDRKVGEACIHLNNVTTNANESVRRLKELFGSDQNYARPYQMAAFLKGATPRNGYKPDKPYTIEVRVNNGNAYKHSSIYDAKVIYLQVLTAGTDGGARNIDVLKTRKPGTPGENGKFFIVFNSPGLDTQVKKIESDASFNGLD